MYKIKAMDIKDYKKIISLWENSEGVVINSRDDSIKYIKKFLARNPRTCFVAEYNNIEIIGTIMGGNDGRRGFIYHLMVKPEHRKNGIGKKLLEKTENNFKKEGIGKIYLLVLESNEIGNKFWEKNDYKFDGNVKFRSKRIIEV